MTNWKLATNKKGKIGNNIFANLYRCSKILDRDIKHGSKDKTLQVIEREIDYKIEPDDTLITHSGDWGIKKTECNITSKPFYTHTIEDAAHGGIFLNLELKSVVNNVKRWYMTNMSQFLHEKIYPIPLNVNLDTENIDLQKINRIEKNNLCYANFTITNPYRIRVAEWAWQQNFIDCNFPKRYPTQDIELNMPMLNGEKLSVDIFLEVLASYNFAICPTGNAIDTFRTWECILCNTVPIVQDKWCNRVFSKIWPMIIVSRYEYCSVFDMMNDFYEEYGNIQYDHSLLMEENFDKLLDRIQYESDRLRREDI